MPTKKPSQERIEFVKTKFQAVELKVLDSNKEKFFKLPYGTALEAIDADLSKTAYRLWIYLSANYPFGDCDVELPSQTELGIRLGVSRQAVNIAAAEIQAAGLWDFWADKWKGRNLKGYGVSGSEGVKKNQQVSKKDDTLSKKDDTECQEKSTPCQEKSTPCQEKMTPHEPEPLPNPASSPPQTIQTYSNFIQTLSEDERESFLNFCLEAVSNYKQPVADLDDWLAGKNKAGRYRFEVQYEKYLAIASKKSDDSDTTSPPTHCETASSTKVPNFETWSASSHEGQYHTLINLGLAKFCENATSSAWYEWARAKHPERFTEFSG